MKRKGRASSWAIAGTGKLACWCRVVAACWVSSAAVAATRQMPATIDFESVPLGTRYGGEVGHIPGEVVLTQDAIDMSVEIFFLGSFEGFNHAEVGGQFADFFPTTPLELNNISVLFDLRNVGFDVDLVRLDYQEFGGSDNFAVNGYVIHELSSLLDLPTDVAPGVTAGVAGGVITLHGNIDTFRIGGQELAIDNIVALPEPTALVLLAWGGALMIRRRRVSAAAGGFRDRRFARGRG